MGNNISGESRHFFKRGEGGALVVALVMGYGQTH